jgi:excinuclease ABC subunit C
LNEIDGVGKKKRMALIEKFGTIDKIMDASIDELATVDGIGEELAKRIKDYFQEKL